MRFKPVPVPPADEPVETVAAVRAAVPLVPGGEDDCCARIVGRTDVPARDEARTWLTFLQALELVERGPTGFRRVRADPEPDRLRRSFRERVYGVDAILEIVAAADAPLPAGTVYERFRERIPPYERHRHGDRLEEVWGRRVERILEWAALFDLVARTDDGYRRE